jgi:hypothetical protein
LQLVDDDLEALSETSQVSVIIDRNLNAFSFNPVANNTLALRFIEIQNEIDNIDGGGSRTNKPVSASSYILLESDVDKFLIFSNACTVVVPNGLAANLEFQGKQGGTGQVTFSAESGGTLNVPSVFLAETAEQHCFFGIRTDGSDVSTILGTLKLA